MSAARRRAGGTPPGAAGARGVRLADVRRRRRARRAWARRARAPVPAAAAAPPRGSAAIEDGAFSAAGGRVVGTRGVGRGGRFPGGSVERARSFERTFDRSFGSGGCLRARPRARVQARAVQARGQGDPLEGRPGVASLPNPPPSSRAPEGSREPRLRTERRETSERLRGCSGLREGRGARGDRGDETERVGDETERAAERRDPERRHRRRGGFRGFGGGPNPSARPEAFRSLPKPLHREPGGHRSPPPAVSNEARPGDSAPAGRGPGGAGGRPGISFLLHRRQAHHGPPRGDLGARARASRGDRAARVRRVPPPRGPRGTRSAGTSEPRAAGERTRRRRRRRRGRGRRRRRTCCCTTRTPG